MRFSESEDEVAITESDSAAVPVTESTNLQRYSLPTSNPMPVIVTLTPPATDDVVGRMRCSAGTKLNSRGILGTSYAMGSAERVSFKKNLTAPGRYSVPHCMLRHSRSACV